MMPLIEDAPRRFGYSCYLVFWRQKWTVCRRDSAALSFLFVECIIAIRWIVYFN